MGIDGMEYRWVSSPFSRRSAVPLAAGLCRGTASGQGRAVLKDKEIHGRIYLHHGDDAGFDVTRAK
ncbi:MAG: hypothetical protein DWI02_06870 [Planctomycetota bacterium]|jgi:hypothetical protein|nr:MAG: hypothetical protein DWI02_06870 [Planctomycetota bacterium]